MLDILVINLAKFVYWILRKLGRHGAALPGLITEKLRPGLLERKLSTLVDGVIVISGTNGKTTTTHLIAAALRSSGKRVLTNHSGSNMTRGLLATIIRFASKRGALPYDIAVLEIDEAYAAKLAPQIKPRACVLTNILRDQLDRFGEIDHTAQLLGVIASYTKDRVIINGMDARLKRSVKDISADRIVSYGASPDLRQYFLSDDEWHTGKKKVAPKNSNFDYYLLKGEKGSVELSTPTGKVKLKTHLSGWHNYINLLAAYVAVESVLGEKDNSRYFDSLGAPYGRGEILEIGNKRFILQLVKNPAGFTTSIQDELHLPALIVINDAFADSRDVSWLWDVDFDALKMRPSLYCSGTRAYDMAVRLKYSELNIASIDIALKDSLEKFIDENEGGIIFLTYTAMLQVRKYLIKVKKAKSLV